MKRQSVMAIMVMAATLASAQAVYASPFVFQAKTTSNVKLISFTLRNDSRSPLKVKVGDDEMTLAPGRPVNVKLASGQQIVAEETTASNQAGEVLATAGAGMDGATISVR